MTKKTRKRLMQTRSQPVGIIGARIRAYRFEQNLTQSDLGQLLGVNQSVISAWEMGARQNHEKIDPRTQAKFEELMNLIGIDETVRQTIPRAESPVPTTTGLRVALSTPEDEFAYSPRKIRHSLDYLKQNVEALLERYERTLREVHTLEQSTGITQEQLATLREKARKWDDLEAIRERKGW